jgi:hypothetical protein
LLHQLGGAVKSIEQRLAAGNNGVNHQLVTTFREDCWHLITQHVIEHGNKSAGASVYDDVNIGRLDGNLLHEIVKAPWINAPAIIGGFDQIDFEGVEGREARQGIIDRVGVETPDIDAFLRCRSSDRQA